MKGRKVSINEELKKKLKVSPFIPGAPVQTSYNVYKLTNKSMYIPRYYNQEGELILNDITKADLSINSDPREYQKPVINEIHKEIINNGSCIACLYTGWGKTFASLYISTLLNVKTLVIVNKESLLEQWSEQIVKFLGFKPGIIQGNKIDTSQDICIGMIQSISMKDYPSDLFNCFSFTIFDETHHYCSKVFSNAFYKIGSYYNLGLSATLKRSDKLDYVLEWFLFKPAVNVQLLIIEPEIHIHNFYDHPENTIKYLPNGKVNSPASITSITEINHRTDYIIKLLKECYNCNRKILVLTDRKAHCDLMYNILKTEYSVGIYYGGMKQENLKQSNECRIILATYQMASEGYDNPKLDTLILASPKGNVEQAVGRILRQENENPALVIDINDCISVFNNWNRKRQSFYKSKKFKILFKTEQIPEDATETLKDYSFREI
jgi:superfamily II DNA or RNA helicase